MWYGPSGASSAERLVSPGGSPAEICLEQSKPVSCSCEGFPASPPTNGLDLKIPMDSKVTSTVSIWDASDAESV